MAGRSTRRAVLRAAVGTMLSTSGTVLLVACGGSATTSVTSSSASAGATKTAAGKASSTAPTARPSQLHFETWGGVAEIKTRQKYTDEFVKSHPTIKVTFTPTAFGTYWSALLTRMAGGDAPDVYYLSPKYVVDLRCRGALLNLSPYVQRDKYDLTDFYPGAVEEYTIAGKLWALARDFANNDIFYNVDLFKKNGVPLPPKKFDATGWTFATFLSACRKLTSGSGPTKTYGFVVPQGFAYMAFIWSNGGDIVNTNATKPAIALPNAVEGLQFLEDLIGKYHASPTPADLQSQNANDLFYTGRIGMMVSLPAALSQFRQGVKGFHWDVAPPPMGPHGTKRWVAGGGAGFGVYSKTKVPDQAWEFMQWITGVKVQEEEVAAGTSMGSRSSVGAYFVKANQGKAPENVQLFVDASAHNLRILPPISNWLQISNVLTKELASIWDASKPAKDVAAAIAGQMAPLLGQPCK